MQVQHQRICLKPERTALFPLVPTPAPTIKTEEQPQIAAIPHAMTMPKQATEKCSWGPHCPICKNEEEHGEEDWDGNLQNWPRMHPKTFSPRLHKTLSCRISYAHSHKSFSIPNHKAVNVLTNKISSHRTIKYLLTFWIGMQNR